MGLVTRNFASSTLREAITSSSTVLRVQIGTSTRFIDPAFAVGDYDYVTIVDPNGNAGEVLRLVGVTTSGDELNVERIGGQTHRDFPIDSTVQCAWTKQHAEDLIADATGPLAPDPGAGRVFTVATAAERNGLTGLQVGDLIVTQDADGLGTSELQRVITAGSYNASNVTEVNSNPGSNIYGVADIPERDALTNLRADDLVITFAGDGGLLEVRRMLADRATWDLEATELAAYPIPAFTPIPTLNNVPAPDGPLDLAGQRLFGGSTHPIAPGGRADEFVTYGWLMENAGIITPTGDGTFTTAKIGAGANLGVGEVLAVAGGTSTFAGPVRITSTAAGSSDAQFQVGSSGALRAYVVASGASYLYATGTLHIDSYNGTTTYLRAFGTGAAHIFQVESLTLQRINTNGVTLGTAAPAPTAGRAFQVSTAMFANALYVNDAAGFVSLPNDNQSLYIGAGNDFSVTHSGTSTYVTNRTGNLYFSNDGLNSSNNIYQVKATYAHIFNVDSTEVARFGTDITLTPASKTTNYGTFVLGTDSAATSQQDGYVLCRPYSGPSDTAVTMLRLLAQSGSTSLYIGGSGGNTPTTNTIIYGGGAQKFWATSNGVVVGTSPAAPSTGQAFRVNTTAFSNSFYIADGNGTVRLPNDGQLLAWGAGDDLIAYHNGTNSYVNHVPTSGSMIVSSASSIAISCTNASAGDITFNTRNGNERFRANGFAGINLAEGDPTGGSGTPPALQLFWSDQGDNKLIAVDPSGAVYSVDLTAL